MKNIDIDRAIWALSQKNLLFNPILTWFFLGWVQYLNVQWGLGGFGTAHVLRRFCFRHQGMFCTPAKCKSSPCSQDSFAPASLVFHANLGRKPYIVLVLVAPEMFELLAMNFQNTVFFFGGEQVTLLPARTFSESNSEGGDGNQISISVFFALGGFDGNDEEWQEQYQVLGLNSFICGDSGNGGLIATDKLKIFDWSINDFMSSQLLYFELNYLHILITHCTMTISNTCLYKCALILCIYVYTARIYSQPTTLLLDFTLDTPRITNFEFSTFKHHLKKVFLRFLKSQEMCSQFGWDTASGISREQFEDLVGDWWVGRVVISSFCRQILNDFQYFSVQIMKLLKILEWKGLCSQEAPFSRCALSSSASTFNVSLILSERRCFLSTLVQEMRRRQLMKNCVRSWWTIPDMLAVSHCRERSDGCDQQGLAEDLISLCVSLWMWISHLNPDYKQLEHRFLCGSMGQT